MSGREVSEDDELELVFKHAGGVELRAITDDDDDTPDTVIWASDSDPDFMDGHGNEIMSGDEDAETVLDYLVDAGILTEDEAGDVEIYDESLDAKDVTDDAG